MNVFNDLSHCTFFFSSPVHHQVCSINTTLLSSTTRLLAVSKPTTFSTLLSRRRVLYLCAAILAWSLLLTSLETSWYVCLMAGRECQSLFKIVSFYRRNYVYDLLAFCVPSLLLLVCNALTVWKVCRVKQSTYASSSSPKERRGDAMTRRLSVTMVMISLTSLLSYPVAVTVRLTLNPGQEDNDVCDLTCARLVVYTCGVLTLLNSSVNFVIYCVISTRFRELLRVRARGLCRGVCRACARTG